MTKSLKEMSPIKACLSPKCPAISHADKIIPLKFQNTITTPKEKNSGCMIVIMISAFGQVD